MARGGDVPAALEALRALGDAAREHGRASGLMGTLLTMSGDPEAALPWFETSLALNPQQPSMHVDLGNALSKLKRPQAAIDSFSRALEQKPDYLPALNNRAGQRLELKDGAGALEDADAALALNPDLGPALRSRRRALSLLDRPADALAPAQAAAAVQPDNSDNFSIRAAAETALGRFADAAASLDQAIALEPGNPHFHQSRAYARLRLGDFAGGWADHEHRWQASSFVDNSRGPAPLALIPRFDVDPSRESLAGQRVLVVGEQGVGDQIMFGSLLSDLLRDAASVTCVTSPRMQSLFETSFSGLVSLDGFDGLNTADFDKVVPLASLAPAYRPMRADFPGRPYLYARPSIVEGWRARLGPKTTRLRVGVSWKGGAAITRASQRSLSLEALRPLLERADCEFVSLQYGKVQAEVDAFNETLPRPILNFPREEIENFEALAGLVANLDLVVSVQTTIIHLSGAVGVPCLVMIPFIPEWRYGATGETMPWYDSVRLLRQPAPGDWAPVLAGVQEALDAFRPGGPALANADLDALAARAVDLARGGDRAGAVQLLQTAGAAAFSHPRICELTAGLLLRLERWEESLPYFEALNRLKPNDLAGHADHAQALTRLERRQEAIAACDRALAIRPDDPSARIQRARLHLALKNHDAAQADFDAALALPLPTATQVMVRLLRGQIGIAREEPDAALADLDIAIALDPDNSRGPYLRARALSQAGRLDEAFAALERTVALDPTGDAPRYLLSMHQLRHRDYGQGWRNYEHRWKASWFLTDSNAMAPAAIAPRLSLKNEPEDFDGRSVLVISEQGIGDQVMFSNALPDLTARAANVTFVCLPKLQGLLQSSFPAVDFTPPMPSLRLSQFDKVVALGSLAYTFRRRLEDFPGRPYLRPRSELIEAWRARLGPKTTPLRVGISWKGGSDKTKGGKRSIDLEQLRPLLERADCEFVSLQYGDVEDQVAAFNATLARPIQVFPKDDIENFEDVAAVVLNLDLVVSVQTALIHLSGAVGAPCLVMIPFAAEWRYGATGETMPWYGSVRLIRQTVADDWSSVIERVSGELDARAQAQG